MVRAKLFIRRSVFVIAALFIGNFMPATTLAAATTCTAPSSSQAGVHQPTGADAATFTYVCDPGSPYYQEWVNPYYVYSPTSGSRTPLYAPDYQYDCSSGTWTMVQWNYSPASGQFYQSRVATGDPGGVATNCPAPAASPTSPAGNTSSPTGNSPVNTSSTNPSTSSSGANTTPQTTSSDPSGDNISNTGQDSSNANNLTANNSLDSNNSTNATVGNVLTGVATSGGSQALSNTVVGDVATGNAQDMQDVVNLLQSSTNALGSGNNIMTFTDNINGDVNGDLLLNPATLNGIQSTGANSLNTNNTNLNNALTVNNATNGTINNNIDLAAATGDANVSQNTKAGNVTTGNAQSIANVVNVIQSALTAGKSFIGTINISGNLNGDILLPPDFINQLLADNVPTVTLTGPSSMNSNNVTVNNNGSITNTNNLGINNVVNASANSGSVNASGNTVTGSLGTGNATTHITAFNLTNSKVIGANDLLVFVNVTGKWVGLIMNAPPGTTAAELGGGISSTGPNSVNSNDTSLNNSATITNQNNFGINNNIETAAQSGSITASGNTRLGNVKTGNADNAVNLLNMENTSLDLSGWFGILFINVFGVWHGSFGVHPILATTAPTTTTNGSTYSPVIAFVPRSSSSSSGLSAAKSAGDTGSGSTNDFSFIPVGSDGNNFAGTSPAASAVLAAFLSQHSNGGSVGMIGPNTHRQPPITHRGINWTTASAGGSLIAAYLLMEYLYAARRAHHHSNPSRS